MTHEELYESKSQMKRVEILKAGEKQMTHEELLAEINERIEELHDAEVCDGFIHALRAVVELHRNELYRDWECQDDIYHK